MQTLEKEIQQLKVQIEEKIHHTFLLEHIKKPVIDEDKLFFLNYILRNTSLAPNTKEQYLVSIMLVQIALDIHQLIPDFKEKPQSRIGTDSQLSILAGDYYSGLYYLLLSDIEEHQFITVLATAIKQINERKMELYYFENDLIERYLATLKQIDSLLIKYVAEFVNQTTEIPVIEEILLTKYMLNHPDLGVNGVTIKSLQESQLSKTKGMIEELPETYAELKHYSNELLDSLRNKNTSWEKDY